MVGYYRLNELGARLPIGGAIIPAEEFASIDQAARLIDAAENRAVEIAAQARRAFEEEKQRGYAEGTADAKSAWLVVLLKEQRELDRALDQIEGELVELVAGCVRKIVETIPEAVRADAVVRQALRKMRREKRAELRAAPGLCETLRASVESLRREFPELELVDVVEDDSLAADQIVVETSLGRVDGDFGKAIKQFEQTIRSAHGSGDDAGESETAGGDGDGQR